MSNTPSSLEQPRCKNKTALIVDNDEKIQRLLQGMLQDLGFETCITWSGYEALALLESGRVDLLLVDDYVPDLHFHDLLKRVGQLPIRPWIVVMQAAAPTFDHVQQYALLGASSVVRKHNVAEVREAVSSCCIEDRLAKTRVN
jgi:CheY-like chemotaxis protein